jgi:hypothetical protein
MVSLRTRANRQFAAHVSFGHWNSVRKRFWRLSRSGTFEARQREHLTEAEVELLMQAAKGNRWGLSRGQERGFHARKLAAILAADVVSTAGLRAPTRREPRRSCARSRAT